MRFIVFLISAMVFAAPAHAQNGTGRDKVANYIFGNSLVNHLSDSAETTVPQWVGVLAKAAGKSYAVDGQWGFLRDFASQGPAPNWSFPAAKSHWQERGGAFKTLGFDTVLITPANFIQRDPPSTAFADDISSPLTTTLDILDQAGTDVPNARYFLYQGWPDMGAFTTRFPPARRHVRRYHAYAQDEYHQWFETYLSELRAQRPGQDIRLIPVSTVLSQWLTGPLSELEPEDIWVDTDPHGTANLYFLAAIITYTALFETQAPAAPDLPETLHPAIRAAYPELAKDAAAKVLLAEMTSPPKAEAARQPPAQDTATSKKEAVAEPLAADQTQQDEKTTALPEAAVAPQPVKKAQQHSINAVGLQNPSLAMGLNGIADWSTQQPFVDLMKTARPWTGHLPGQWGGYDGARLDAEGFLDANGWPLRIPTQVSKLETFVLTDLPEEASSTATRYILRWKGDGDIRLGGRAENTRYSYSKKEATFDFKPGDGPVSISFSKTSARDHLREFTLIREDQQELFDAGVIFNPQWVEKIADLRLIRFMDWMFTNASPQADWSDRPQVTDYTYIRRGVPVEMMLALANQIGADPWFNVPHLATDDYARSFAAAIIDGLDPRLKAHVEYSNELWNFIFAQTQWAAAEASRRWGEASDDQWMQLAGGRAAEVAQIFTEVYGDQAEDRLVNIIAVHTGWPGLEEPQLSAPLWVAEKPGRKPPAASFDAYAVAGYFGYDVGSDEKAESLLDWLETSRAVAESQAKQLPEDQRKAYVAAERFTTAYQLAASAIATGSAAELIDELFPYHAGIAAQHGLDLIMYEGGTHATGSGALIENEDAVKFFTEFSYTPEMAALYGVILDGWTAAGGTAFNAFVDVSYPSKWGSWGALRHLNDTNPRWDILMAFNGLSPDWAPGRAPGAFLHGVLTQGSAKADELIGTVEEDTILGGAGNDRLISMGGNDHLHGGAGQDVAVLKGSQADFAFARDGAQTIATADGQRVILVDIESIIFSDAPDDTIPLSRLR